MDLRPAGMIILYLGMKVGYLRMLYARFNNLDG